jgi:hypothetical protein
MKGNSIRVLRHWRAHPYLECNWAATYAAPSTPCDSVLSASLYRDTVFPIRQKLLYCQPRPVHPENQRQADFLCGKLNGITFPYAAGGIHFVAFFLKLLGTQNSMIFAINHPTCKNKTEAKKFSFASANLSISTPTSWHVWRTVDHAERQSGLPRSDQRQNGVRDHTGRLADQGGRMAGCPGRECQQSARPSRQRRPACRPVSTNQIHNASFVSYRDGAVHKRRVPVSSFKLLVLPLELLLVGHPLGIT